MIQQTLSLPVLTDLALAALEDAVDDVALDYPGVASSVRSGHTQRQRESDVLRRISLLEADAARCPHLQRLDEVWRRIEQLKDAAAFPDLWKAFVASLDQLDVPASDRDDPPDAGFELQPVAGNPYNLLLRQRSAAPRTRTMDGEPNADPAAFVAAVTALCAAYRQRNVCRFSPADRLALLRAYQLVETGVRPAPPMLPLRTDLWRPVSTYLALADPGRSHLRHTVRRSDLLNGTMVHVETIDRDGIDNRSQIEAYRIPAIRDVARIRVHIGDTAPCSVYVGRPVFEGWSPDKSSDGQQHAVFELARLKAIHTVAAACSGLFALGVAECKIGMDGLTATQALDTMKSLAANVIRDRTRQRLSAAFNINTTLYDDRQSRHKPTPVSDRLQVATLAIDLAKIGGFDKVTWDGATNGASVPFLEQLKPAQMLSLVHRAHELGLETYVSAGMTAKHMLPAAQIGVGGVGIGIALHTRNSGGAITHILTDDVLKVLETRDHGARHTIAGRGAAALAQLDWMKSLGSLDDVYERKRAELLKHLSEFHEANDDVPARIRAERQLEVIVPTVEQFLAAQRDPAGQRTRGMLGVEPDPQLFAGDEDDALESIAAPALQIDPIFVLAEGSIRAAVQRQSLDEAKKLKEMVAHRDAEGLRCYLGYQ